MTHTKKDMLRIINQLKKSYEGKIDAQNALSDVEHYTNLYLKNSKNKEKVKEKLN